MGTSVHIYISCMCTQEVFSVNMTISVKNHIASMQYIVKGDNVVFDVSENGELTAE